MWEPPQVLPAAVSRRTRRACPYSPWEEGANSGRRHWVQVKAQGQGRGETGHWAQELLCRDAFRHMDQQAFMDSQQCSH